MWGEIQQRFLDGRKPCLIWLMCSHLEHFVYLTCVTIGCVHLLVMTTVYQQTSWFCHQMLRLVEKQHVWSQPLLLWTSGVMSQLTACFTSCCRSRLHSWWCQMITMLAGHVQQGAAAVGGWCDVWCLMCCSSLCRSTVTALSQVKGSFQKLWPSRTSLTTESVGASTWLWTTKWVTPLRQRGGDPLCTAVMSVSESEWINEWNPFKKKKVFVCKKKKMLQW